MANPYSPSTSEPPDSPSTSEPPTGRAYANYVLGLLFLVYVLNFVDRTIISILLEDIKADLNVSDTAMGFLTGFAFALFYTFAGIPIARWADVGVRRSIISIGIAVWSFMTAVSGLAQNFTQLALARIGVGVGEAACSPPAHSLIADYFPPQRRATALSVYNCGTSVGILFGMVAGGWISEWFGWRWAFFIVGMPGIFFALLVRFTIREPQRGASEGITADEPADQAVDVFRFLWRLRSFRHLAFASGLMSFATFGFSQWAPTFLRRVHDVGSAEAGTYLGLIIGIGGATGAIVGGIVIDRLSVRDARWYLWVPAISGVLSIPLVVAFVMLDSMVWALVFYAPSVILTGMWLAAAIAVTQLLVKLRMRAIGSAILFLVMNLIGMGMGPQAVGLLNDFVFDGFGVDSIRYSLLLVKSITIWAAIHFTLAARSLRADMLVKNG